MSPLEQQIGPCPRILLVDDDVDQRELIVDALRMYYHYPSGQNIQTAGSSAECMAMDLASFDVMLLDYNLPDATGLSVLEKVLQQADIPVIFVTGENVAATAAEAIQHGAQDYMVKLGDYLFAIPVLVQKNIQQHRIRKENLLLQAQLKATLEEVRVKNLQLEDSLQKLEHMAATDALTGLANRRHFGKMLDRYFGEAQRYDFDLTCMMMDLDHYKILNDALGHQMGDKILVTTAQVIQANLRSSDLAARYGGDEFVVLLPHTSTPMAVAVADRIRCQIELSGSQYLKVSPSLTMSIGIASMKVNQPANADALVAMADRALYASKDNGKNRIIVFDDHLQPTHK